MFYSESTGKKFYIRGSRMSRNSRFDSRLPSNVFGVFYGDESVHDKWAAMTSDQRIRPVFSVYGPLNRLTPFVEKLNKGSDFKRLAIFGQGTGNAPVEEFGEQEEGGNRFEIAYRNPARNGIVVFEDDKNLRECLLSETLNRQTAVFRISIIAIHSTQDWRKISGMVHFRSVFYFMVRPSQRTEQLEFRLDTIIRLRNFLNSSSDSSILLSFPCFFGGIVNRTDDYIAINRLIDRLEKE